MAAVDLLKRITHDPAVTRIDAMSWELDHVFFASVDADAAEAALAAFGFAFTVHRVHPGQGTSNACAVFENAFFEVLRSHDREELDSELVRPLGLGERIRWRETGACPFGLCFRPTDTPTDPVTWPFETWQYAPPYVLDLQWDRGREARTHTFQPRLPITVRL